MEVETEEGAGGGGRGRAGGSSTIIGSTTEAAALTGVVAVAAALKQAKTSDRMVGRTGQRRQHGQRQISSGASKAAFDACEKRTTVHRRIYKTPRSQDVCFKSNRDE